MSGRGAPRGRSGSFGRGGPGARGGRGSYTQASYGPPASILEMGTFMHASEGEMVCESINPKIPYFNAPIFLENKTTIGKVDEVLGPINQVYFTVKPQQGIQATSFKVGDKVFIGGDKLLPLEKFLPKPKPPGGVAKSKKPAGDFRGGARGGRGSRGGGRGAPRGRSDRGGRGGSRGMGGRGGGFSSGRGGSRGGGSSFSRPFRPRGS